MNDERVDGIALIAVMLCKFRMTWLLGVRSDPMLTIIDLPIGYVGVVLLVLGRRDQRHYNNKRNSREFPHSRAEKSWSV